MLKIIFATIILVLLAGPSFAQRVPHYKWDDPSYSGGTGDRSLYMSNTYNRKINERVKHQATNHEMLMHRVDESGDNGREYMKRLNDEKALLLQQQGPRYRF